MFRLPRLARYEIFIGADGQFYWRLKAANHEIVAVSEGYTTLHSAKRGARTARRLSRFAIMDNTVKVERPML